MITFYTIKPVQLQLALDSSRPEAIIKLIKLSTKTDLTIQIRKLASFQLQDYIGIGRRRDAAAARPRPPATCIVRQWLGMHDERPAGGGGGGRAEGGTAGAGGGGGDGRGRQAHLGPSLLPHGSPRQVRGRCDGGGRVESVVVIGLMQVANGGGGGWRLLALAALGSAAAHVLELVQPGVGHHVRELDPVIPHGCFPQLMAMSSSTVSYGKDLDDDEEVGAEILMLTVVVEQMVELGWGWEEDKVEKEEERGVCVYIYIR